MSASCYVGCTAPPVKPPTIPPTHVPTPLAFTGAGPGLHELLLVGVGLVVLGAIILTVLAVKAWRKTHPYVVKIDTSRKARASWFKNTPATPSSPNVAVLPVVNPFHLLPKGATPPAPPL